MDDKIKFQLIGEINYMLIGAELDLSVFNSFVEEGASDFDLFHKRVRISDKIKLLKKNISESDLSITIKDAIYVWTDRFSELKEIRNDLLHSFMVESPNIKDEMYRIAVFDKEGALSNIKPFKLEDVKNEFVKLKNHAQEVLKLLLEDNTRKLLEKNKML